MGFTRFKRLTFVVRYASRCCEVAASIFKNNLFAIKNIGVSKYHSIYPQEISQDVKIRTRSILELSFSRFSFFTPILEKFENFSRSYLLVQIPIHSPIFKNNLFAIKTSVYQSVIPFILKKMISKFEIRSYPLVRISIQSSVRD